MGWMSWQFFRCNLATPVDDCTNPLTTNCISEALYKGQTDALVSGGFLAAGYNGAHMDDCWPEWQRDPATGELVANRTRFPSGIKALADYMHAKNVQMALYTAESSETCAGYPASLNHETLDANTFASWGVDYLKVDGCGNNAAYPKGYKDMGAALAASGRNITYSCSWPAYIGNDETQKPFDTFIADNCNLWRNWDDVQCDWGSVSSIIEHWGTYGEYLSQFAAPGHWHDPDMLLAGIGCITTAEEQSQMALWSISAAPLIMGNDLRNVSAAGRAILLNPEAIAVDQDPAGKMGFRITPAGNTEVWARNLSDGAIAVGLYNKLGSAAPAGPCPSWNVSKGSYIDCGASGNIACFDHRDLAGAEATCCGNPQCAGFSYSPSGRSGCYKSCNDGAVTTDPTYDGYFKPSFTPPTCEAVDITVDLTASPFNGRTFAVRDIWARADAGTASGSYTAKQVPCHGTAFFRMTPQ